MDRALRHCAGYNNLGIEGCIPTAQMLNESTHEMGRRFNSKRIDMLEYNNTGGSQVARLLNFVDQGLNGHTDSPTIFRYNCTLQYHNRLQARIGSLQPVNCLLKSRIDVCQHICPQYVDAPRFGNPYPSCLNPWPYKACAQLCTQDIINA